VLQLKPAAQVALCSHTHAHDASSHVSPKPQPPQPGLHSTVHVVALQRSLGCSAPTPQSAGHTYEHVVVSHANATLPLGGGRDGSALHVYEHVDALHVKSGDGGGDPQSDGHSQAHVARLHSAAPSHPPQSTGQRNSQVATSQTALGPGAVPPQSAGHA
jgi:hypothetical protein